MPEQKKGPGSAEAETTPIRLRRAWILPGGKRYRKGDHLVPNSELQYLPVAERRENNLSVPAEKSSEK